MSDPSNGSAPGGGLNAMYAGLVGALVLAGAVLATLALTGFFTPKPAQPSVGGNEAELKKISDEIRGSIQGIQVQVDALRAEAKSKEKGDPAKSKVLVEGASRLHELTQTAEAALRAIEERNKKLELEAKIAREEGAKERVAALEMEKQKNDELRKQYQTQLEEYKKKVEEAVKRGEPPTAPPPAVASAPPPSSDPADTVVPALLRVGVAAVCVIKPPLCWLTVMVAGDLLGLFDSTEHRDTYLKAVKKISEGRVPSPEELNGMIAAILASKKPSAFEKPVTKLKEHLPPELLAKLKDGFTKLYAEFDKVNKSSESTTLKDMRRCMEDDKTLEEVLKCLPAKGDRPYFRSPEEQKRVEAMCKAKPNWEEKYWDPIGGLGQVQPEEKGVR